MGELDFQNKNDLVEFLKALLLFFSSSFIMVNIFEADITDNVTNTSIKLGLYVHSSELIACIKKSLKETLTLSVMTLPLT